MNNKKRMISIVAGILVLVMILGLVAGIVPILADAATSSSELKQQLQALEKALTEKAKGLSGEEMLSLLQEADEKIKDLLGEIFAGENDFHKALGGVSLLAVAGNGNTVAQNLFAALETVLEAGAQKFVDARVEDMRADL